MNLRKIIKEEISDFENLNWINKVSNNPWMEYEGIINYIVGMYKPVDTKIDNFEIGDANETVVSLYFDEISDNYITNTLHNNFKKLKESNLGKQIRKDVYDNFGVMTSGLSLEGFAPYVYRGLTIDVHLKN